jgi:hypothetical protein
MVKEARRKSKTCLAVHMKPLMGATSKTKVRQGTPKVEGKGSTFETLLSICQTSASAFYKLSKKSLFLWRFI